MSTATRSTENRSPTPFTIGAAFKKYGRRWMTDRPNRKQLSEKVKRSSFNAKVSEWLIWCRWLDAPLSEGPAVPLALPKGGARNVRTFLPDEFALIDQRMKAQAEGVWYCGEETGRWFSAEQYRRGEHRGEKVREFVTAKRGAVRHRVTEKQILAWGVESCVYLGNRIERRWIKTFAMTPTRWRSRHRDRGHEWVYDSVQLAEAVKKKREMDFDPFGATGLAPASVWAKQHGVSRTTGYRWARKVAAGSKPKPRKARSGNKLRPMLLYDLAKPPRPIAPFKTVDSRGRTLHRDTAGRVMTPPASPVPRVEPSTQGREEGEPERPKRKAGNPGVKGKAEQFRLELLAGWRRAKADGISQEDYCASRPTPVTVDTLKKAQRWKLTRDARNKAKAGAAG